MSRRRQLPAYGRDLRWARDLGHHPSRVWLLAGDDWGRRPTSTPTVCIQADAEPEVMDWRALAGVPVEIVDRGYGPLLELGCEVARVAAPVTVHWIAGEDEWPTPRGRPISMDIAAMAVGAREPDGRGGYRWPRCWSEAREADYLHRVAVYRLALAEDLGVIEEVA